MGLGKHCVSAGSLLSCCGKLNLICARARGRGTVESVVIYLSPKADFESCRQRHDLNDLGNDQQPTNQKETTKREKTKKEMTATSKKQIPKRSASL